MKDLLIDLIFVICVSIIAAILIVNFENGKYVIGISVGWIESLFINRKNIYREE